MGLKVLIDNDALLKLSCYGLLDETIAFFGCSSADVFVLATAKYCLLPVKDRLRFCRDEDSATRLENFLKTASSISAQAVNPDLLDTLNSIPNIDAGEAILLAAGAVEKDTVIITGDKRALAVLCSHEDVAGVSYAWESRVVSMEVLFLHLITHSQFAHVQDCVRSKPRLDKALTIAFGFSEPADFNSVQEGLTSYVQDLRNMTGMLLYPVPS
ncbi:MAG: hypothetical protein ACFBSF_04135 [Leptolyngbyaceae cyanobacterium]